MLKLRPSGSPSLETVEQVRLGRARTAVAIALAVLIVLTVVLIIRTPRDPLVALQALATIALLLALVAYHLVGSRLNHRREARDAAVTRILSGLSRSVSSEAIVQAIVDELHRAADADHVVVSRLRPADGVVETTLVASNAEVPASRTLLPVAVLDPENAGGENGGVGAMLRGPRREQIVAEEIARRVGQAYGLSRTLAAPLVADGRIVGALVLSRRSGNEWSAADRRLLAWSAEELSAALARAFAFEEANTRANIDLLTGLPNRRYLEELLSVVGPRRRAGDMLGALMIDIDHFKRLNDRYGHATGDRVLHAVGQAISGSVRAEDTPARYGGEEFAVVLRQGGPEHAVEIAERIRRAIATIPPSQMGVREHVSVSVGVAVSRAPDVDLERLLQSADKALYRAKREGRDRVVLA
ncbi:MAG TPA: sensor domain-containing diguanylate cyclase [Candidatus Caenarcaniphilales bacterium]|nr:sensor domain-containing diguanylate cyclase [Candidatus Caenarcaniphilales bacterium]